MEGSLKNKAASIISNRNGNILIDSANQSERLANLEQ